MKTDTECPNQRRSLRRNPNRLVTVQCINRSADLGSNISTAVLDISTTGICLIVNQSLEVQGEVDIVIGGHGLTGKGKRLGYVRWQLEVAKHYFGIGVEFQEPIDEDDWTRLATPEMGPQSASEILLS